MEGEQEKKNLKKSDKGFKRKGRKKRQKRSKILIEIPEVDLKEKNRKP